MNRPVIYPFVICPVGDRVTGMAKAWFEALPETLRGVARFAKSQEVVLSSLRTFNSAEFEDKLIAEGKIGVEEGYGLRARAVIVADEGSLKSGDLEDLCEALERFSRETTQVETHLIAVRAPATDEVGRAALPEDAAPSKGSANWFVSDRRSDRRTLNEEGQGRYIRALLDAICCSIRSRTEGNDDAIRAVIAEPAQDNEWRLCGLPTSAFEALLTNLKKQAVREVVRLSGVPEQGQASPHCAQIKAEILARVDAFCDGKEIRDSFLGFYFGSQGAARYLRECGRDATVELFTETDHKLSRAEERYDNTHTANMRARTPMNAFQRMLAWLAKKVGLYIADVVYEERTISTPVKDLHGVKSSVLASRDFLLSVSQSTGGISGLENPLSKRLMTDLARQHRERIADRMVAGVGAESETAARSIARELDVSVENAIYENLGQSLSEETLEEVRRRVADRSLFYFSGWSVAMTRPDITGVIAPYEWPFGPNSSLKLAKHWHRLRFGRTGIRALAVGTLSEQAAGSRGD